MSALAASTEGLGIVVALPAEARSLGARGVCAGACTRWRQGWMSVSGMGSDNAMRAAERLLACGVRTLASWGVAGALDARLAAGDVLVPELIRYCDDEPDGFTADPAASAYVARQLSGSLHVYRGVLWSSTRAVASSNDKRRLAERTGAIAVDMEAAAVAAVAARARLPFIAVKAICDPCTREIPPRIARAVDDNGGVSLAMLSALAFGGPATWRAARLLARDFASARQALATAAQLLAVRA